MNTKSVLREMQSRGSFHGLFSGWGGPRVLALNYYSTDEVQIIADTASVSTKNEQTTSIHLPGTKLNTFLSLSIAGCDLMGSALYTAGTCTGNAGKVRHKLSLIFCLTQIADGTSRTLFSNCNALSFPKSIQ
jgi:hypothetical protein